MPSTEHTHNYIFQMYDKEVDYYLDLEDEELIPNNARIRVKRLNVQFPIVRFC